MAPEGLEPETLVEISDAYTYSTRAVIALTESSDKSEERVERTLFEACASNDRDLQEWALYGMDILMPSKPGLVGRVLNALIDATNNHSALETVSRYFAGSQYTQSLQSSVYYEHFSERYLREYTENIVPQGYVIHPDPGGRTTNSEELIVIVHGTWTHGAPIIREIQAGARRVRQVVRDFVQLGSLLCHPSQADPEQVEWPVRDNWYEYPQLFPDHLDKKSGGAVYKPSPGSPWPFSWSGRNEHNERAKGAVALKAWIDIVRPEGDKRKLTIVAHSHGGNVALHAAARHGLKIDKLILLGTPIRTEYPVNLGKITELWNVYSEGDYVQQIGGLPNSRGEARTLSDTREISNVFVETGPSHSNLHDHQVWETNNLASIVLAPPRS